MNYIVKFTCLYLLLICASWVEAQEKLVFSAIPGAPLSEIGRQTLTEAYNKIGIKVSFVDFPGERALIMSNLGKVDGETMRIVGIDRKYSNLLMVPISYVSFQGVVFTKELDFVVNDWNSQEQNKNSQVQVLELYKDEVAPSESELRSA